MVDRFNFQESPYKTSVILKITCFSIFLSFFEKKNVLSSNVVCIKFFCVCVNVSVFVRSGRAFYKRRLRFDFIARNEKFITFLFNIYQVLQLVSQHFVQETPLFSQVVPFFKKRLIQTRVYCFKKFRQRHDFFPLQFF